jgi:hypothetical protein
MSGSNDVTPLQPSAMMGGTTDPRASTNALYCPFVTSVLSMQ